MNLSRIFIFSCAFSLANSVVVLELFAQDSIELDPIIVTANRAPDKAGQVGSAVTIFERKDIERSQAENVAQLLQTVPGLSVNQSGGVGGEVSVFIRGADSDQTLVLIDGIRVNDPASTGSEFDFSVFSLSNVERVEVIRGPQSGLYGSDAIGGVINIVTRKGEGAGNAVVEAEGGSYRTFAQRAYAGGSDGPFSLSVASSNFRTSGFSRYADGTENDATRKQSINARLDYDPSDVFGVTVTAGRFEVDVELDSVGLSSGADTSDTTAKVLQLATAQARLNLLEGAMQNKLTFYVNSTERDFFDDNGFNGQPGTSYFEGMRYGGELQSDIKIREMDRLTVGGKLERLTGESFDETATLTLPRYDVQETTSAAFALYNFNPIETLTLTAAGRIDDFGPAGVEPTYRFTAAYRLPDTGTKFHASYGSGAKAPTIQQRFENSGFAIGNPDLSVETSKGYDIGVEQQLLNGDIVLSGTYFSNHINDLIALDATPASVDDPRGSFRNIALAEIEGVELAATISPASWVTLRSAYTYLQAVDGDGDALARRPENTLSLEAITEPFERLQLSAKMIYVGERFNRSAERDLLDDYVRVDLAGRYQLDEQAELFMRVENIFDTEYEEVRNFGTAGRSAYAGVRARF